MNPAWAILPAEIRLLILQILVQDGCPLSSLVAVCREWQRELERHNFSRIRLTPSRLVDFGSMIHRNRAFVNYIWFCLEIADYDCTECAPDRRIMTPDEVEEAHSISHTSDGRPITTAFETLFSVLSKWDCDNDLVLDISIYSPSDADHWFKYLTFTPDTASDLLGSSVEQMVSNRVDSEDPQHGWVAGVRHFTQLRHSPLRNALRKVFHDVMGEGPFDSEESEYEWWDQLPSVSAVTSILLRQQNRRRWRPGALAHLFARFPRLREIHYEPWREWGMMQSYTDRGFQRLFDSLSRSNQNLRTLVVFENFNEQYAAISKRFLQGVDLAGCDDIRQPTPAISQTAALASRELRHLAASFLVDASHFFTIETSWRWLNLESIVLTSQVLTPDQGPIKIRGMLHAAAAVAATKMPRLKIMEIWNGRRALAALFKYQVFHDVREATITWRATWKWTIDPSTVGTWKAVVHDGYRLRSIHEWLDKATIKSHGDAVHHLMLSSQVIRHTSLQQIRMEQKFLQRVPT